jgi:hypothetical protein
LTIERLCTVRPFSDLTKKSQPTARNTFWKTMSLGPDADGFS